MKRYLVQLPVWCVVAIVALLITAIWTAYSLLYRDGFWVGGWNSDNAYGDWTDYAYDGSLVEHTPGWGNQFRVVEPPTVWGLFAVWWPAIASIAIALLTLAIAPLETAGRVLRKRIRIPRPRLTLFRVMVVIGTVSAWLWLGRFDLDKRIAGTLIFGFLLHAGFRRAFLAREARIAGAQAADLRVGIAAYSLVLLLALAWVISILVWDSYQEHRF